MAVYFLYPFGTAGDRASIPNPTQPSGSMSYQSGFTSDYQKTLGVDPDAKPMPRSQTNQLFYDITSNIQAYQQFGAPNFISSSDNGGSPFAYSIYAITRYDDGGGAKVFMSLTAANTSFPSSGGVTNANWLDLTTLVNANALQQNKPSFVTATGTANALVATPVPAYLSIGNGASIWVKAANTNTGAATLAVSGLSATAIRIQTSSGLTPLIGGEIVSGSNYLLQINGGVWQLMNPSQQPLVASVYYAGAGISVPPTATVKIPYGENEGSGNTINFDPNGLFDTTNLRMVAKRSGFWRVSAYATAQVLSVIGNGTSQTVLLVYINGVLDQAIGGAPNISAETIYASSIFELAAGDYVEIKAYNSNGSSTTQIDSGSSTFASFFEFEFVRE